MPSVLRKLSRINTSYVVFIPPTFVDALAETVGAERNDINLLVSLKYDAAERGYFLEIRPVTKEEEQGGDELVRGEP